MNKIGSKEVGHYDVVVLFQGWCHCLELMCGSMHIISSTRMCVRIMSKQFGTLPTGRISPRDWLQQSLD